MSVTQRDVAKYIAMGIATLDDLPDRITATIEVANALWYGGFKRAAQYLRDGIDREEAIKARLCPDCGSVLEAHTVSQRHPYGDTYATEEWVELECPVHGEVTD